MPRIRTFYPRQIKQLQWLASVCAMESARHEKGAPERRFLVTCRCHTCGGEDKVVTSGWAGYQWILDHSRHSTYMTAEEV